MTIPLTGSGSLFVRMGHEFGSLLDVDSLGGAAISTTRVTSSANLATRMIGTIQPDYNNGTAIPQVITAIQADFAAFQTTLVQFPTALQGYAQNTLKAMYGIDKLGTPSNSPLSVFSAIDLATAMKELIRQMIANSDSVQAATVSAGSQTAVGTPTGNAVIVVSLKNGLGFQLQLPFPETLLFRCTADSQTGGTAVGNETVTCTGDPSVSDPLSPLYPNGSGVNVAISAADGASSNSAGNLLQNSDWQTFTTTNYPDNWTINTGAAGTTVFNGGTGDAYRSGGGSLKFTGDAGGTLISVTQSFNTTPITTTGAGGTSATLTPNFIYHLNGYVKVSAVPGAGVLSIALVDSTNTVIQNDQGTNQVTTIALTGLTTAYSNFNVAFQLPKAVPSTVKLRIWLSTAIDSGKSVFMSLFSLAQACDANGNGIYAGGPFVTIHSGSTALVNGTSPDTWTVAISNSYETSGSGLMQLMMDRVFGLRTLVSPALQLPYSGSPTVADSLIA